MFVFPLVEIISLHWSIAQLVEHSPDTRKVIGSTPITPIIVLYTSKGSEDMKYFSPGDLVTLKNKAVVTYVGKCSDEETQHIVHLGNRNYAIEDSFIVGAASRKEKMEMIRFICGF